MKFLARFGFLILSLFLILSAVFAYIDYKHLLVEIEKKNLLIEVWFNDGYVAFAFLIISFFELLVKNKNIKILIRVFLILIFLGIILKNVIPIEDFDAGIENTIIFSGIITLVLLFAHGLKILYDKKYKLPAANKR